MPNDPDPHQQPAWRELRKTFAERALNFRTLSTPLRVAVGAGYAQILVAIVLLGLRNIPRDHAPIQIVTAQFYYMLAAAYDVVLATMVVAWALFLTGAFLAHPAVRAFALGSFTLFVREVVGPWSGVWGTVVAGLVACLWVAFFVTLVRRPRSFTHTFVPFAIAVAAIGGAAFAASRVPVLFATDVTIALSSLTYGLIAILAMAGGELGDWSQLGGSGIASFLERIPRPAMRALIVVAAALAFAEFALTTPAFWRVKLHYYIDTLPLIVLIGFVVFLVAWSARRFGTPPIVVIPWFALLGAGVLFTVPLVGGPIVRTLTDPVYRDGFGYYTSGEQRPKFTMQQPTLWHEIDFQRAGMQGSFFRNLFGQAVFVVEAFPDKNGPVPPLDALVRSEARPSRVLSSKRIGDVQEFRIARTYGVQRVLAWRRHDDGYTWVLEGGDVESAFVKTRSTIERMRKSFKAGEAPPLRFDVADAFGVVLVGLVGIAAGLTLLRRFSVAATFFSLFAALYVTENLAHFIAAVTGGDGSGVPVARIWTIEFVASIAAVALLAILAQRRNTAFGPASVIVGASLVALALVHGVFLMYDAAISAGEISVVQAGVVLVALSWDIVMSGESITNGDSPAFPRAARLGMFLGYVMFVSASILYFASLKDSSGNVVAEFGSEGYTRIGVLTIGIPVVLTAAVLRLVTLLVPASLRAAKRREPHGDEGSSAFSAPVG